MYGGDGVSDERAVLRDVSCLTVEGAEPTGVEVMVTIRQSLSNFHLSCADVFALSDFFPMGSQRV